MHKIETGEENERDEIYTHKKSSKKNNR